MAGRRVLDVGCGRGYTLRWLQRWGADVSGTQLSEPAAVRARGLLGKGRVFVGELADARYPARGFDCVMLWHVLEHVPDPVSLLREIARILKPDGLVYIEVPNAGGWSARRLGRHWLAYDIPRHLVHFTPKTLERAMAAAGFVCLEQAHGSLEYSPVTLLQSLLNAWLGGESLLFRALSFDGGIHEEGRRTRTGTLAVHVVAAAFLAVPSVILSVILARRRSGDTFGVYGRLVASAPAGCGAEAWSGNAIAHRGTS